MASGSLEKECYALTQTLKPQFFKYRAHTQLTKTFPNLQKLLKLTCLYYTVQAELTDKANIHYHGTLTFISEAHKMAYIDSARTLGFICLKKITNIPGWHEYITKDTKKTMDFLRLEKHEIYKEYAIKNQEKQQIYKILSFPFNNDPLPTREDLPPTLRETLEAIDKID